eukprot:CAMPEP_0202889606 /NCGR_PEP_ID=MMETSP1392-20130828/189_1 /ASSEMBLY_ACC=CAM_ASM_000868 /TAXON_ID=225041 /ORGANISM="Chlamydomonas chlamydogama, Strain SAG 11-48b" /LENGTH=63 /DNA_ID=CAMNT_0049572973 /DNA_START=396 /DNA_END=587 /DNA_ORIENTATION=-
MTTSTFKQGDQAAVLHALTSRHAGAGGHHNISMWMNGSHVLQVRSHESHQRLLARCTHLTQDK